MPQLVREVHIQSCAGTSVWISAFRVFHIHTAGQSTTITLSTPIAPFSPASQITKQRQFNINEAFDNPKAEFPCEA